ncbi:hypothetical protein [Terrisporobacter mayombei]|nr:hypothetical protein [Terrisporobacter mayombei]MCC3867326.1 hypothetical protein [Terrisporobacter mayombei]
MFNQREATLMASDDYQDKLVQGISNCIHEYFKTND